MKVDIFGWVRDALEENGIKIKAIEGDNTCVHFDLDFSEHDKLLEDKIASIEKQIEKLKDEKSFLRTRCMPYIEKDFDNGLYGKLAIVGCNEEFVDIQKYADGDDLYSREVRNLISEGGIKRLIGQYKNISARLDKISAENKGLKQRIAELEGKESVKTMRIEFHADNGELLTPLEVANSLINQSTFKVDELRELSEFLQVYCNHHEDRDIEPNIMLFSERENNGRSL